MIGFRGGVIGIGTDIGMYYKQKIGGEFLIKHALGGSIRVPSAFNFLYGIRPSHGRMPYAKMANSMEGQETVHSVVGPMAHSAAGMFILSLCVKKEPTDDARLEIVFDVSTWRRTLEV